MFLWHSQMINSRSVATTHCSFLALHHFIFVTFILYKTEKSWNWIEKIKSVKFKSEMMMISLKWHHFTMFYSVKFSSVATCAIWNFSNYLSVKYFSLFNNIVLCSSELQTFWFILHFSYSLYLFCPPPLTLNMLKLKHKIHFNMLKN
jgi:hypothetical protein